MSADAMWEGIPRRDIPWFPMVDTEKCTGCRECYGFCSHGVYGWDDVNDKTVVRQPYECVVGCSTCGGMCAAGAISFPPLAMLKELKANRR
jgi:NAD-dependent dihydropyrimidine dehydrogenase PreA subunit